MSKPIDIDGSEGEGGGQMLRTSLSLALLTGKPFRLRHIRARRSKPGLQAQHLMSVQAAGKIGNARLRGATLGSSDLTFEPTRIQAGDYRFTIGTAGATSLVLHTICLPLVFAKEPSVVVIEGGTHVKASPCFEFLARSWRAYLKAIGIDVELSLERAGFYPRGGGRIQARIAPAQRVQPFQGLTPLTIDKVNIVAGSAGLPEHVADRMGARAEERLNALDVPFTNERLTWPGGGPGCMLGIEIPTRPAPTFLFSLGERGKPAETVAEEAVAQVEEFLAVQTGVDEHSADQLLLPLALADGPSAFRVARISSHLLTNADVIRRFVDCRIECTGAIDEPGTVTIIPQPSEPDA